MNRLWVVPLIALAASACAHRTETAESSFTTMTPVLREPAQPREITRYADENRDGKVTRDEAKVDPNLARVFDQYDSDKDGVLDRAEFARLEGSSRSLDTAVRFNPEPLQLNPEPRDRDEILGAADSLNRTGVDQSRSQTD